MHKRCIGLKIVTYLECIFHENGCTFLDRITNDAREDEMENNMGQVATMVGNLRNMAIDMGSEIESQNRQIDRVNQKVNELINNTDRLDSIMNSKINETYYCHRLSLTKYEYRLQMRKLENYLSTNLAKHAQLFFLLFLTLSKTYKIF